MKTKEELKEQITKKLTDMGFESFSCILTTNAEEGYIKIVYPELGLCFFKEYSVFYSPFSSPRIVDEFEEDIDDIEKFNKALNLGRLHD